MKLKKHQQKAIAWAKWDRAIALLWPTGTGKSIGALSICKFAWKAKKILILCRANNVGTWTDEIAKFGGINNLVISHDSAWRVMNELRNGEFDALIVDEGYQVQNFHSRRAAAAYHLSKKIGRAVLLNALPFADQGYMSIFSQYKVLDCGMTFGTSATIFREEYQYPHPAGFGFVDRPQKFTKLTRLASVRGFMLDLKDCDLPKQIDKTFYVQWKPEQKRLYKELQKNWEASCKGSNIQVDFTVGKIVKLHQLVGGVFRGEDKIRLIPTDKIGALSNLLDELSGHKVVVWCAYNPEVFMLAKMMSSKHRKTATYTGKSDCFPQKWDVLFAQIQCGVGINDLENVSHAIFYSQQWNWYYYQQVRGRTARISSQHKTAFYFHLHLKGSIDDLIVRSLERKNTNAQKFATLALDFVQEKSPCVNGDYTV